MARAKTKLVDRQLACMPLGSPEGRDYLGAMQAAANFAFGNRRALSWLAGRANMHRHDSQGAPLRLTSIFCAPAGRW